MSATHFQTFTSRRITLSSYLEKVNSTKVRTNRTYVSKCNETIHRIPYPFSPENCKLAGMITKRVHVSSNEEEKRETVIDELETTATIPDADVHADESHADLHADESQADLKPEEVTSAESIEFVISLFSSNIVPYDDKITEMRSPYNVRVTKSRLGSVVTLFFDLRIKAWRVATKTNSNAMMIRYHNTNLGKATMNALPDKSLLNEDYCYSIFVPDVLISGHVEHVGTIDLRTGDVLSVNDTKIGLPTIQWDTISTWDEIGELVNDLPFTTPGLLIKDTATNITYHLKNDKFKEIEDLLGNNKSLVYLVCGLSHLGKREEAIRLLPNLESTFKFVDNILNEISDLVYDCYKKRFIGIKNKKTGEIVRTNLVVHAEIHTIMQHMHKEYLQRVKAMNGSDITQNLAKTKKDYNSIIVTKDRIIQRIWIYSPKRVYKLVNDYISHKDELMKVSEYTEENLQAKIKQGTTF